MARTKRDFRIRDTRLCFTLPATLGDRGAVPYERLREPADLGRWIVVLGLTAEPIAVSTQELERAKTLRATIQRAGISLAERTAIDPADRSHINAAAARPSVVPRLTSDFDRWDWQGVTPAAVESYIARDFIALAHGALKARVKQCANPECRGLFVDESRPNNRRWCSMRTCGDLMKKRRFRGTPSAGGNHTE